MPYIVTNLGLTFTSDPISSKSVACNTHTVVSSVYILINTVGIDITLVHVCCTLVQICNVNDIIIITNMLWFIKKLLIAAYWLNCKTVYIKIKMDTKSLIKVHCSKLNREAFRKSRNAQSTYKYCTERRTLTMEDMKNHINILKCTQKHTQLQGWREWT